MPRPPRFSNDLVGAAPWVAACEWREELGSTSDYALDAVRANDTPLPLLVVADRQTAGRGRAGRSWLAGDGALTFSVALAPSRFGLSADKLPAASLATALAVCEALEPHLAAPALKPRIKWPNDVYLGDRKACGVLLEAPAADRLVIGVGLNANNRSDAAPPELRDACLSVAEAAGREVDTATLLVGVLAALGQRLRQLGADSSEPIDEANRRSLLTGRRVTVEHGGERVEGLCHGFAEDGALRLESPDGPIRAMLSGTVVAWDAAVAQPSSL
ncbi:Bifunctional ligase/repressor BirA [Pseudobythopirellula maris]|uniref:biotin--[biotin carboxyl-carrier protein] ligase n=1 Tax=Pseudobythopirellula maris TaxID=2527991 RepID=A0A5C5ZSX1_9BACT|nr:biotin--[acetyl-CoA-carboxylase] ligase [Pseudobythopirellula maris]TWT90634.1 Bifunctional ligase/repressor BirA [Pseudobythopirellula maris]